ncbi:amphi-Trp domain-containing protein [Halorarius halobius]|uniref:amphi-Trp domain-containing protein n=1 Tax=Halorarius halobius TaxID=2962671 RepID=UPI0020CBE64B|nr:amphi-Trp domain-containing protein [Halorarius halobius]
MEEILFESERRLPRTEIASLLRTVADNLDAGEAISLSAGESSYSVEVPENPEFEVKVERETGSSGSELSIEFEMEWDENGGDGGALDIE